MSELENGRTWLRVMFDSTRCNGQCSPGSMCAMAKAVLLDILSRTAPQPKLDGLSKLFFHYCTCQTPNCELCSNLAEVGIACFLSKIHVAKSL
jgi:hypothetical protein